MNINLFLLFLTITTTAVVGWAQSFQAHQEKRELRAELSQTRTDLFMVVGGEQ